jgi:hypothetical protein
MNESIPSANNFAKLLQRFAVKRGLPLELHKGWQEQPFANRT